MSRYDKLISAWRKDRYPRECSNEEFVYLYVEVDYVDEVQGKKFMLNMMCTTEHHCKILLLTTFYFFACLKAISLSLYVVVTS